MLEVTWYNGKKMLDTKNANYSYGSLQKVLEYGLSKVKLEKVNSILVLGMGGGSIIASLKNKYNYQSSIHAIEFDKKIIEIAHSEFGISSSDNFTITHQDAFQFVKECNSHYDLIIVDLFIDQAVPSQFLTPQFCSDLQRICSRNILFNLGINLSASDHALHVVNYFRQMPNCKLRILEKVSGNTLLLIDYRRKPISKAG